MRKINFIALCLVVSFCLFGCDKKGSTDKTIISIGKSKKFDRSEIGEAIECVKKEFESSFKGANLSKVWYDEGESNKEISSYLADAEKHHNKENYITIYSNFDVGSLNNSNSGLMANSKYTYWKWILMRSSVSKDWKVLVDGY